MATWKIVKKENKKPQMNIVNINLDLIKPYWRNPRKNESAVAAVTESIKKYGMNVPIVVDKNYVILTGHTRYKALRALGITEAPVVVADISEKKAKQFRIADNKAHEFSEWDVETLKSEIEDLMKSEGGSGLEEVFGSSDWREMLDISSLLPDSKEETEEDREEKQQEEDKQNRNIIDGEWGLVVICPHCLEDNILRKSHFEEK
jgi:hypothetical protein